MSSTDVIINEVHQIVIEEGSVLYGRYTYPMFNNYICALIHNLYVKEQARNKGLGRKLLNVCVLRIKKKWPNLEIKIVAQPSEPGIDKVRLINFYKSIIGIDEVIIGDLI